MPKAFSLYCFFMPQRSNTPKRPSAYSRLFLLFLSLFYLQWRSTTTLPGVTMPKKSLKKELPLPPFWLICNWAPTPNTSWHFTTQTIFQCWHRSRLHNKFQRFSLHRHRSRWWLITPVVEIVRSPFGVIDDPFISKFSEYKSSLSKISEWYFSPRCYFCLR